ncbi:MAG: MFS transporter [Anaerolineaceae bacterium]|nr:MFS transporter [Anaerolineaceae bacterium]
MSIKEIEKPAAIAVHQEIDQEFESARVVAVSSGHLTHDTFTAFLSPLFPLLIEKLSMTRAAAGSLMLFIQGPSLIQPLVGRLADRVNLRFVVILAPAITATAMSLIGIAPTYAWLALLLTIVGISSAFFHAVGPVLAGNLSGNRLGKGMSIWMVGGELGRMMGPLLIVSVVTALSLERSVWIMVIGWLASLVLYFLLRDIKIEKPAQSEVVGDWQTSLHEMSPIMVPLVILVFTRAFVMTALGVFLPTYLTEIGADLWLAGAALTIFEAAMVLGTLLGGSLSDRFGRRQVLMISMITVPILVLAFLQSEGWLRLVLLFGIGLMAGPSTPVLLAVVQESFPAQRSFANGVYMASSFIIRSLASVLLGAFGDWFGLDSAFTISAIVVVFGIPFVRKLPKKSRIASNGSAG